LGNFSRDRLELYLPLGYPGLSGSPIVSKDHNNISCTVTGAIHTPPTHRLFDNLNDEITAAHHANIDIATEDFSIGAWIKCTADSTTYHGIFWKESTGAGTPGYALMLQITTGFIRGGIENVGGGAAFYAGTTDLSGASAYSFVVMTVDRDSATGLVLYVNGVAEKTDNPTAVTTTIANSNDLMIGTDRTGTTHWFGGNIGEVFMWKGIALSLEEVNKVYNGTKWRYI